MENVQVRRLKGWPCYEHLKRNEDRVLELKRLRDCEARALKDSQCKLSSP